MSNLEEKISKKFNFQGKELTYCDLKNFKKVKTYFTSSHKDRILLKDEDTGNLFLYDFDEYLTFDDRGDIMNELYILVKDENDSDKLNTLSNIRRKPFIHVDNHFDIGIYE